MSRIDRFVLLAERLAAERQYEVRFPFVCLMTKGSKVLAIGYNSHKTHPIACNTRMESLHAEMDCIRKAKSSCKGATLYVIRLRKTGFGKAKPCAECQKEIEKSGIKRVVYTETSEKLAYTVVKL